MSKLLSIYVNLQKLIENGDYEDNINLITLDSWSITEEDQGRIDKFIERQNEMEQKILEDESPF